MLSHGIIVLSNDKRKIAKFIENGMVYKAINNKSKNVIRYQIDCSAMSCSVQRCDNALEIVDENNLYFIELKGMDIKKAAAQILSTISHFVSDLTNTKLFGRIICSRVPRPDLRSTQIVSLERKLAASGGNLIKASQILEETI